jgi:hypothetical protein
VKAACDASTKIDVPQKWKQEVGILALYLDVVTDSDQEGLTG